MIRSNIAFCLCFLLLAPALDAQEAPNSLEQLEDEWLAKDNPEYYNGLKEILVDFEAELIERKYLEIGSYTSYVKLLHEISEQENNTLELDYHLNDSIKQLRQDSNYEGSSLLKRRAVQMYLDTAQNKLGRFEQKLRTVYLSKEQLSKKDVINALIESYGEGDFTLPTIQLKFAQYIDPNSSGVRYIYVGGPIRE